ncbi:MAG: HAD family phosphatase [Lachnospiraceae bacterium]|nr:HAD family phosphatase [Lachnospiraceae bacterium]
MIANIVFDIGMVLADFCWYSYMTDKLGFSEERARLFGEKIVLTEFWHQLDLGVKPEAEVFAEMKEQVPEFAEEAEAFFSNLEFIVRNYDYSRDWIVSLKERGYKVYLLSNYPRGTFTLHHEKVFDFVDVADGRVISGFEKLTKPDRRIYELLCNRYGLKPEECVFLDDQQVNIDAARAYGMKGVVFRSYEQAKEELEEILKDGNAC